MVSMNLLKDSKNSLTFLVPSYLSGRNGYIIVNDMVGVGGGPEVPLELKVDEVVLLEDDVVVVAVELLDVALAVVVLGRDVKGLDTGTVVHGMVTGTVTGVEVTGTGAEDLYWMAGLADGR